MKACINILFLGGSKRVSVGELFIQAGIQMGRDVKIFSYELDNKEPIACIGTIITGLKWKDPLLYGHLRSAIRDHNIHIVVPFVDIATVICSRLKGELADTFFCVSDEAVCSALYDKKASHDWFVEKGFPVPSIEKEVPLVAKPLTGSGAKGMFFLRKEQELDFFLNNCNPDEYFVQKFVEGEEFSVDCYISKADTIISIVPRKRLEVTNGEATRSITVRDEEIIRQTRAILRTEGFSGPVTVQYIRDKSTGMLYLIEINPRLGSGVLTSCHAGADICRFILNDFLDIPGEKEYLDWKDNILMVRAFKEFYFDATNN